MNTLSGNTNSRSKIAVRYKFGLPRDLKSNWFSIDQGLKSNIRKISLQCKIFILRPMSQGPFVTKKEKSHLGLGNGKPKLSSDDGGGSFLSSLVGNTG